MLFLLVMLIFLDMLFYLIGYYLIFLFISLAHGRSLMAPVCAQRLQLLVVHRLAHLNVEDALVEMVGLLWENLARTIHIHWQDFQAELFGEIEAALVESTDATILRTSALRIERHTIATAYQ